VPYEVKRSADCPPGKPFGVYKKGTNKSLGCHATEVQAQQQLKALYAQEARAVPPAQVGEGTFRAREVFSAAEAIFTEEADGPIRADVVIIRPGESVNRRFYTQEAIDDAINTGFWENSPMYVDHPDDLKVPHKRKLSTLAAALSNIRKGPTGEAIGTATFFDQKFGRFAMEAKDHIGTSGVHYFQGQRYRGSDQHYHERVDKFLANVSVDFVAFPAAGGGIMNFLPAMESEDDVDWDEITPEMLAEHRPDLVQPVQAAAAESQGNPAGGQQPQTPPASPPSQPVPPAAGVLTREDIIKVVSEAIDTKLDARDKAVEGRDEAASKVKGLLDKSGLPEPTRQRIQTSLLAGTSFEKIEELATEAIDGARAELKAAGAGPRMFGSGPSTSGGDTPKQISLADAGKQSSALGNFFAPIINQPDQTQH
jgi:hypothetical protein